MMQKNIFSKNGRFFKRFGFLVTDFTSNLSAPLFRLSTGFLALFSDFPSSGNLWDIAVCWTKYLVFLDWVIQMKTLIAKTVITSK